MENTLTIDEINILGNIVNHTFGKSAINDAGYSITTKLHGNNLELQFKTVITLNDKDGIKFQKGKHEKKSNDMLNKKIASIKKEFKEEAGRSIKFKDIKNTDSLENITMSSHRKVLYYRRNITFEIS